MASERAAFVRFGQSKTAVWHITEDGPSSNKLRVWTKCGRNVHVLSIAGSVPPGWRICLSCMAAESANPTTEGGTDG